MTLRIRQALRADVGDMHRIRLAVRQNQLHDPMQISEQSYVPFLDAGGAWVAEMESRISGFAIVEGSTGNVWAIFVEPGAEGQGVGRALHERMLQWSREQGLERLWLTTDRDTRAENFYRQLGWLDAGPANNGEVRFERQL
jgi:GNAT superfamily N-acetyltransferase